MKKILVFLILLLTIVPVKAFEISSKNVILYNLDNNQIIYQKSKDERVKIASLTKLMTALVVLDKEKDLDKQVVLIDKDFEGLAEANAVTAGFTKGEVVTYRDLLYGLLLPSGADAAKALARNTYGNEENFIKKMNEKVKTLKLKNTHFSTTIGLDDSENYSSVYDLSIIFKEDLKNKDFKKIITTKKYITTDGKVQMKSSIQKNANKFNIDVAYILGGKTGTTNDAGLCLATIANKNKVNYMLITTGALYDKKYPHHIMDAKTIYDYYINNYGNQKLVSKDKSFKSIKVKYSSKKYSKLYPNQNVYLYLPNNYNRHNIKYIYKSNKTITPFIKKNTKIGNLKIYYKNKLISTQSITLQEKIPFSLFEFIKENYYIPIILIAILYIYLKKKPA
jgi:D-alanyl-D-alanine carboxypeptidase